VCVLSWWVGGGGEKGGGGRGGLLSGGGLGVSCLVPQAPFPVGAPREELPTAGDNGGVVLGGGHLDHPLSGEEGHLLGQDDRTLAAVDVEVAVTCDDYEIYSSCWVERCAISHYGGSKRQCAQLPTTISDQGPPPPTNILTSSFADVAISLPPLCPYPQTPQRGASKPRVSTASQDLHAMTQEFTLSTISGEWGGGGSMLASC